MTEAFEFLISRGHGLEDLRKTYTIDQVWLFYEAAIENRKFDLFDFAIAMRLSFGAEKKEWMKFIDILRPKQKSLKTVTPISPRQKLHFLKEMLSGK